MNKTIPQAAARTVDEAAWHADEAVATHQAGVGELAQAAPAAISASLARALGDAEGLARRGIERAREASGVVRDQAVRAGDHAVTHIQHKPVQSVLIAAAAGALVAALVGWAGSSRAR